MSLSLQRALVCLVALACAVGLASALPAAAQESLTVDVSGADPTLVRGAIDAEVARLDPKPAGRLTVRKRGQRATVVYVDGQRQLERTIVVQSDARESAQEIALLAASLMRDDTVLPQAEPPSPDAAHADPPDEPIAEPPAAEAQPDSKAPVSATSRTSAVPAGFASQPRPEASARAAEPCSGGASSVPVGFDVAPYVGTSSSANARKASRSFALGVFGGLGNGLTGFELGGVLNVETASACGEQLAGLVNVVRGQFRGAQQAGAVNVTGAFEGVQVAGVVNVARDVAGVQLAGALNVARGEMSGAQLSGAVNVAGNVDGLQLGLVNVSTGRVRGVQVGLVNVSDSSDLSLGLVNVNASGRTHIDVWSELEIGLLLSAVKHGGEHWHSFYGIGTRLVDPNLVAVLGLGGHVRFAEWVYLDVDAIAYLSPSLRDGSLSATLAQARAVVGFNPVDELAFYAGPSFNAFIQDAADDWAPAYGLHAAGDSLAFALWPGATLGVQVLSE